MNRATFAVLSLLALSACENTRKQFDFSKKAPDEFAVVRRAPLEIPEHIDISSLPTPQPGAARPQEVSPVDQARASVLGTAATPAAHDGVTPSELAILERAGAVTVPAHVRTQVDEETAQIVKDETPAFQRLKRMMGKRVEEHAVEVDPTAETLRLRENREAGRPVAEGETAIKED